MKIEFTLNNLITIVETEPTRRLIDLLREDFKLTGTRESCGEGECGSCTILLDGELALACLIPVGSLEGRDVVTIEGFQTTRQFEVLARAFAEKGAIQCGFCTPGMILAGAALLRQNANPSEGVIRESLSGNLCRCTGYNMIVEAVMEAAAKGGSVWQTK